MLFNSLETEYNQDARGMTGIQNNSKAVRKSDGFQIFLLMVFFVGFIVDVFFIPTTFELRSDIRLFSLLLLWIFLSRIAHFTSRATFKVAIGFLIILFLTFLFFRTNPASERVASWIYFFLLIGVIQQFLESRRINQPITKKNYV